MIGRLQRVALREVWKHEALDFTRWLVENPDVLSDLIGRQLVNLAREQSAGAFSVDVTGETSAGEVVVIENQLERSDHDHLGKLVTYVAALGARLGVWIVADPRPEHIGAVNWLNEAGTAAFFLLKLEAVRIGESAPAPLLTLITGPSEEALEVGEAKKELAARHIERQAFWRALLSTVKSRRTHLFSAVSPSDRPWISTGAGKGGMLYHFRTRPEDSAVEFAVERPSPEENDAAFEQLQQHKDKIESAYGGHLQWRQRSSRRRAVAISETFEGGYRSPDRWPELHSRMIDAVIRLDEALKPFVETPTAST